MGKSKAFKLQSRRADFGAEDEHLGFEWNLKPHIHTDGEESEPENGHELDARDDVQHRGDKAPVLFWRDTAKNGYLSNWYRCKFRVGTVMYTSTEQYLMHERALMFEDDEKANQILGTDDPRRIKQLGRAVRGFKDGKWNNRRRQVMMRGLEAKFKQNEKLCKALLATFPRRIAEASPSDRLWGIGLAPSDPLAQDPRNWRGENALGELLEELRQKFIDEAFAETAAATAVHSLASEEDAESAPDDNGLDAAASAAEAAAPDAVATAAPHASDTESSAEAYPALDESAEDASEVELA